MIDIVPEIGRAQTDGYKVLRGTEFEIRLTLGDSNYFAPDAGDVENRLAHHVAQVGR